MAKKKKSRRVRRGLGAAKGACKIIRRADGRSQQLCHTGKRWTFMSLAGAKRRRRK